MKHFLYLLILMSMISCSQFDSSSEKLGKQSSDDIKNSDTKGVIQDLSEMYKDRGMLIGEKRQGPWISYHEKSTYPSLIANYENGVLDGPYDKFNEGGELVVHAFCRNGEFEGKHEEYEKNVLVKRQFFVNGKVHGEVRTFYPESGQRMSIIYYKNGLQDSIATYYNENGLPIHEYIYKDGEQISSKEITPE